MTARVLDTRGMKCPWPALRLARLLREESGPVEVLADDPVAPRELAAVAAARGLAFAGGDEAGRFRVGF
ncbi:sulfurtransferase TusA family protein [Sphingomonas sp. RS2018]